MDSGGDSGSDSDGVQAYGRRKGGSTLEFEDSSDEESYEGLDKRASRAKRKNLSKEQRMLGIWAQDDSDNDFAGLGAASALKPIGFVAATEPATMAADTDADIEMLDRDLEVAGNESGLDIDVARANAQGRSADNGAALPGAYKSGPNSESASESGSESESESESSSEADSDSETDSNSSSNTASGPDPDPSPERHADRPPGQSKPALKGKLAASNPHPLPSKEFGKFANSAVWKMMAKMGYTPGQGLGKHGEGRVEPVTAYVRNPREGIASGGSERPPDDLPLGKSRKGTDGARPKGQQRRAGSTSRNYQTRPKTEYKAIDELETQTQARMKEVFVDMTTNTEAGSLSELVSKRIPASEKEKLASDVRLGLDLAFARIQDYRGELLREENRQSTLSTEVALLRKSIEKRRLRIECLKAARAAALAAETAGKDTRISSAATARVDLHALFAAFADMHRVCEQSEARCGFSVWDELQLERVVTSTMHPHLARLFRAWDPLEFPRLLQDVLGPLRRYAKVGSDVSEAREMTPLESLLAATLVPRLKQFLFTEWDPMADSLIELLDVLPQVTVAAISQDIGSVLQRHVSALDPRGIMDRYGLAKRSADGSEPDGLQPTPSSAPLPLEALRVDRAVMPWLPFIDDHRELVSSIRRKLCAALDRWEPSKTNNKDIVALVTPWIDFFQGRDLQRLCAKIAERLEAMLCSSFEFNAHKQSVWPFKVLVKWHGVLPFSTWFSLVRSQVLPRFLDYLGRWLEDPGADYAEVADWYWQWRQQYPAAMFEHGDVQQQFRRALVLMASALARREQQGTDR